MRKKNVLLIMLIGLFTLTLMSLTSLGTSNETVTIYSQDWSLATHGWTLNSGMAGNKWERGPSSVGDHTGTGEALGTNLISGIPYIDVTDEIVEAESPVIDISDSSLTNIKLTFWHWYNFSDSLSDGGGVYLYNGTEWFNPLNLFISAISGDTTGIAHITGLDYGAFTNEQGWGHDSSGE